MAVAARGGNVAGVIFHAGRGSTYTADYFTGLSQNSRYPVDGPCRLVFRPCRLGIILLGSGMEGLSRRHFAARDEQKIVIRWACDFCNKKAP